MMLPGFESLIGEIKSKRKDLGWSQKELANRAGVSQSLVAKLERKTNVPNYKSVRRIYTTLEKTRSSGAETAGELANPEIVSVSPDDSRGRAAEIMKENEFSQLPVRKGEDYIGIVLSKDLGTEGDETQIEEVMRYSLPIIPHNSMRPAVAELLKTHSAVLVKGENGEIIGIVTPADLL